MLIRNKKYKQLKDELDMTDKVNESLKTTINSLEDENRNLKISIKERDKMLEQELEKRVKLESKITDLENNAEFLFNNLSIAKQKRIKNELSQTAIL